MAEATTTNSPRVKSSKPSVGAFEMPKFEIPKFEIPKVEMPAAFREFAERGVAQAKDTYEKMKAAAEEATDVLETTYSTATKGASDYGLKVIEAARVNTNAAFDFAGELITAKTLSEVIELSSAHARKQFEALTEQGKELSALAQKVATETVEPIKSGEQSVQQGRLIRANERHRQAGVKLSGEGKPGHGPGFCFVGQTPLCTIRTSQRKRGSSGIPQF